MVLGIRLLMGLGAISLRSLVSSSLSRLVLGAGPGLGTGLGKLAIQRRLLRLGASPAGSKVHPKLGPGRQRSPRWLRLHLWPRLRQLRLYSVRSFPRSRTSATQAPAQ